IFIMSDMGSQSTGYTKKNTLAIVIASVLIVAVAVAATVFFLNRSQTIATVNGEKISKDELYEVMYENVGSATLENLITERLVEQEAKKQNITISSKDIQDRLDQIIEQNFASEAEFTQALMMYNMSKEDMEKNIKNELMILEILGKDIEVEEEEMKDYFANNRSLFDREEQVKVRHILVEDEEEASQVLQELNNGADFADLAKEKSIDGSKDNGGDLGFVKRQDVVEEFGNAAFSLEPNEISGVVKSDYGYHVLQVLEKQPAQEAVYEDFEEEVHDLVLQSKVNEQAGNWIMELRNSAKVEYKKDRPS
ncbi:MAG TPA: peptidylprolyl isomerase, partial [Clostridia bacterium]|nr:peptidylprolyl isomerase [Clostridia bacterium]